MRWDEGEISVLDGICCWSTQRAGAGWCPPDCVEVWGCIPSLQPSLGSPPKPLVRLQPLWLSAAPSHPICEAAVLSLAPDPRRSCSPFPLQLPHHSVSRTRLVTGMSLPAWQFYWGFLTVPSLNPAVLPTLCLSPMQGVWQLSSTRMHCRHSSWSWEPSCWQ